MLDYLGIFGKLNGAGIRYIVVGGIAVNLYGIPRMTYDVDLLLEMEDGNIEKFLKLLKRWGFKPKVPVDIMDFAKAEKREDWIKNKNMKAFNLVNPAWAISEIDVLIDTPISYAEGVKHVKHVRLQGVQVPVISIDDLIKMKKKTEREQDASDIINLRNIRNGKK